jgi:hypothetical protein
MFFIANFSHGLGAKASTGTIASATIKWRANNYNVGVGVGGWDFNVALIDT